MVATFAQIYYRAPIVSLAAASTAAAAAIVGLDGNLITNAAAAVSTMDGPATADAEQVTASASLGKQGGDSLSSGEDLVEGSGRRPPTPLLDKYTFVEHVRTVVEEDQLPDLPNFLESIGLGHRLEDFYRKSVFETKYLFAVNDMDLRLMDLSAEEMVLVKERASELKVERDVTEERLHPLLERRNELTYGRLFVERSASSFEFYLAGFGPPAPVDGGRLVWAEPRDACNMPPGGVTRKSLLSGAIVLAERGRCSFVDKANNVASSGASALVVINNGEDAEDLFRVAATLGGRSGGEVEPKGPENMATVLVRGSTLPSLSKTLEWGAAEAKLVPLDCKPGKASCAAVLPEEQGADNQVDSGTISVSYGPTTTTTATTTTTTTTRDPNTEGLPHIPEAFDFLSATFGATFPAGEVSVVPSLPEDACSSLATPAVESIAKSKAGEGAAVLVKRGGCSFGVKAKNAQDAGGRVIIIQDNGLGVLQNVGAPDPLAKELYIPGVFITARAGEALSTAAAAAAATPNTPNTLNTTDSRFGTDVTVTFHPNNSVGKEWGALGAIPWPEDLLELRVLAKQLRASHAAGGTSCRSRWVEDKVRQAEGLHPPPPAKNAKDGPGA
eukprot:jgi/Undpi1/3214/HiC_scaffold_15.g06588.m1